jgi:RNase H-like domain found in reverse transcriptase
LHDIVIASENENEKKKLVTEVLPTPNKSSFSGTEKNWEFLVKETHFLGYKINKDSLTIQTPYKTKVEEFPSPNTIKELQQFPGLCNYIKKFRPTMSHMLSALTNLLKNTPNRLNWNKKANNFFLQIQDKTRNAEKLNHPNFDLPLIVITDASEVALGGLICQSQTEIEYILKK